MKIGFDAKRYFNNRTGLGNYSRTLISNLNAYYPNHEYILYTPSISLREEQNKIGNTSNICIRTAGSKNHNLWRSFEIKKDIKNDSLDIYHGLSHELPRSNDRMHCKKVVTIHDLIFKTHPSYFPYIDRSFYHIKCKHCLHTADVIIAISENTKKDIVKYYSIDPNKIQVVYQACHPRYYNIPSNLEPPASFPSEYLLSVGSLEKRKNITTIIQAYAQLEEPYQIPLLLIGNGRKHKNQLRDQINRLNLQKKISILSNIPSEQLPAIYQNAQMVLYPSFYEGFGLPVAEALLSSTPVITSRTSSLPEAGGPATYYVDPTSADEITQGITTILSDSELASTMIKQGKQYAMEKFNPETLTHQMMDIYSNVLAETFVK